MQFSPFDVSRLMTGYVQMGHIIMYFVITPVWLDIC